MGRLRLKGIIIITLVTVLSLSLFGCNRQEEAKLLFSRNTVRHIDEDGWVYTCSYFYYNDGSVTDTIPPITFTGINLRYRYGNPINTDNPIQMLGEGVSEETDRDMEKIASFLGYGSPGMKALTVEEIMSKDRSALKLEAIDEALFFDLLDKAVNSNASPVGKYIEHPSYGLLCEQNFEDGYAFQIGYMVGMGCIDVMMIDVLYKSDDTDVGYVQLSDLVKNNIASQDQKELYAVITDIAAGIVNNNDYLYGKDDYKTGDIASIDLSRLYHFLSDLEKNNYAEYVITDR